jgi:hypothetical protein
VQQTIAPDLGLTFVLPHWNEIAAALAERNRQRVPQLAAYQSLSYRLWGAAPGYYLVPFQGTRADFPEVRKIRPRACQLPYLWSPIGAPPAFDQVCNPSADRNA